MIVVTALVAALSVDGPERAIDYPKAVERYRGLFDELLTRSAPTEAR